METNNNNPLLCDPIEGFCGVPEQDETQATPAKPTEKAIKVIYFTDPICSSCWGLEPQLRKLKLEYGDYLDIEYRMGGLLPDWSYNSGGISKPSDVAHHWNEVSLHYEMPIDGDLWLEDPLDSSYPPSVAFKAAQIQDKHKALSFLRDLREMVFLRKKNITRWEHIAAAASRAELDTQKLLTDYNGIAKDLFKQDLNTAKDYGVRGFPTMFFINEDGDQESVYGSKPYHVYERTLLQLLPGAQKKTYTGDYTTFFSAYPSLTAKELATLSAINIIESETTMEALTRDNILDQFDTKNGSIWYLKAQ